MNLRSVTLWLSACLALPALAIGPEECTLHGALGGGPVHLVNIDAVTPAYGQNRHTNYAYCEMVDGYEYLRCANTKGQTPQHVYHVAFTPSDRGPIQNYRCISGCKGKVVQKFVMTCAGD